MVDIVEYISVAGISAGALCLLLVLVLVERPRNKVLRLFAVGMGIVAIGVPIIHMSTALGRATPWLTPGEYTIHGWKTVENAERIYLLVAQENAEEAQQFELPFDPVLALELQGFQAEGKKLEMMCLSVHPAGGPDPQFHIYRILGRSYMAECPPRYFVIVPDQDPRPDQP